MGGFAAASGKFWKDLYLDASFVHWQKPSEYRPQTQLRAVMGVNTEWRSRFPSGDFGFHFESGASSTSRRTPTRW